MIIISSYHKFYAMTYNEEISEFQEIGEMSETARNEGFAESDIEELEIDLEQSIDELEVLSPEESEDASEIFTAFDAGEITLDEAEVLFGEMGFWSKIKGAVRKVRKVAKKAYKVGKKVYKTGRKIYRHPLVKRFVRPIISRLAKNTAVGRAITRGYRYARKYVPRVRSGYRSVRRYLPFEDEGYSASVSSQGFGSTTQFGQGNVQSQQQGCGIVMIPVIIPSFGVFPVQSQVQPRPLN